jgi:2-amino-4-hydroxy-6-hydroxymethyldihydropteridine diphosphokinase
VVRPRSRGRRGGIYIAAGSNLGDRATHILSGLRALEARGDIRVRRRSTLHETSAVGGPAGQPRYLNAAAELATELPPGALLERLLAVEADHGRVRVEKDGARTLDLDLLIYRDRIIEEPGLSVPHPRMWSRAFVMAPLREICPASRLMKLRRLVRARQAGAGGPAGDGGVADCRCTLKSPRAS